MIREDIVFGVRPVMEALREGKTIEKILLQKNIDNASIRSLRQELGQSGKFIPLQYVPLEKLDSLTRGLNHQGVVALCSGITYHNVEEIVEKVLEEGRKPLLVLLDHVTDVRNLGAIARTCECVGADCLIVPDQGSAAINESAVKTSAGALLRLPICKTNNIKSTLNYLKQSEIKLFAATEKADKIYTQTKLDQACCLIMGSEDKGISKQVLNMCETYVKIPIKGKIESLNVSVAAGIILYEIVRQRNSQQ